jgi:hypothetical protein
MCNGAEACSPIAAKWDRKHSWEIMSRGRGEVVLPTIGYDMLQ